MTQRGMLSPLTVSREAATLVGDLVVLRMLRDDWQAWIRRAQAVAVARPFHSLAHLPAFGNKLRNAARRQRSDKDCANITLHRLARAEAEAGFHFLALHLHPDTPALKNHHEASAVHDVCIALAQLLEAKPGRQPLSRTDAEAVIADYRMNRDPGVRTWAMRLMNRFARLDRLGRTLLAAMPPALHKLFT